MLKAYHDKETEFNWEAREKAITRLRGILRGNATDAQYYDTLLQCMKQMVDGVIKAVSLHTLFLQHNKANYSRFFSKGRKFTYSTCRKGTTVSWRYWCLYGK
jgi:hypothetical protein